MQHSKDDSVRNDLRFWLVIIMTGALLSYLIINYPA